ncbi:MAG: NUDIX domain-containing protein [Candidatus Saccharimonadales bacterium]
MASKWQTLASKYVLENPWYKVRQDIVIRPDGKEGTYNVVESGRSVFVIPITSSGKIVLIKLYRYTTQHEGWEVPAGGVNKAEDVLVAAKRELQEETGLTSENWDKIGTFDSMNGMSDAAAEVFEARSLTLTSQNEQAEEGITKVGEFAFEEVFKMIRNGQIVDGLSIAAIMQVCVKYGMVSNSKG